MAKALLDKLEAELTAFGLELPEATASRGWGATRELLVRKKTFVMFGAHDEQPGGFSMTCKLPVSYEMVQELSFVRPGTPWYRKNNWVKVYFEPDQDGLSEVETLKAWTLQSYIAVAPKPLGRSVREMFKLG